ncbi:MAG: cysteine--tRNA ligase [Lachnospiraceae bacterium]|nr:cysteine--tRNA ligase [Lachnospiraceae bacterium]
MRIHNTMTKQAEEFRPIEEGKVRMYVCGPTVYNLIHIGNARPMIFFDTVRRYLEYRGFAVNYVSNFTDVDDKIIKAAQEEGLPAEEISERYIAECQKDMESLNVLPASTHPKATEEIDGMVRMIDTLVQKGHAYPAMDGTVYFRSRSFAEYGKLSHKNLDDLRSGERALKVDGAEQKEDPLDFVLWKPKKEGEPAWPSPWCEGRPGWHIECSEMSRKYLGEEIDIHGGGEDLVFPHHENEIAQSECCSGKSFARYWMHNAFLNIDNKKMSKSEGNFFTVRDVLQKYDGQVLRFFMLSAHYRSPLNFSEELMESAKTSLHRIVNCWENLAYLMKGERGENSSEAEEGLLRETERFTEAFVNAMDDDFNTADGIAAVFELVRFINSHTDESSSMEFLLGLKERLQSLTDVLGISLSSKNASPAEGLSEEEIEAMIAERTAAKKEKNFARADEIRATLLEKGIVLEDTREGVRWKRA